MRVCPLTLSPKLPGREVQSLFLDLRLRGPYEPAKEREEAVSPRRARERPSEQTADPPLGFGGVFLEVGPVPSGVPQLLEIWQLSSERQRGCSGEERGEGRDVPSISCLGGLQYAKKLIAELPPNVRPLPRRTAAASVDPSRGGKDEKAVAGGRAQTRTVARRTASRRFSLGEPARPRSRSDASGRVKDEDAHGAEEPVVLLLAELGGEGREADCDERGVRVSRVGANGEGERGTYGAGCRLGLRGLLR